MIQQGDGRWAEAESHYRRELAEAERLTQISRTGPSSVASWREPAGTWAAC